MKEFTISFWYNNQEQKAGVVRSDTNKKIEYNVRPIDTTIVEKFGQQITIYKENEDYRSNDHIDKDYEGFFNSVVEALRVQDRGEE